MSHMFKRYHDDGSTVIMVCPLPAEHDGDHQEGGDNMGRDPDEQLGKGKDEDATRSGESDPKNAEPADDTDNRGPA
jgi:hypothetical protein